MTYDNSMNTVLIQEMVRYNRLIEVIKSSLTVLEKTLNGFLMMTPEMEAFNISIKNNQVPSMWKSKSYPSLKPLMAYVVDL